MLPCFICTSYFANAKNIDDEKFCKISIAASQPSGCSFPEYRKLAPTYDILNEWKRSNAIDKDSIYSQRYISEVLSKLSPEEVISEVREIAGSKIPVLLCYEKRGKFCHRTLVVEWLKMHEVEKRKKGEPLSLIIREYDDYNIPSEDELKESCAKTLKEFNRWRRGEGEYAFNEDPSKNKELGISPVEIGQAIDFAISYLESH